MGQRSNPAELDPNANGMADQMTLVKTGHLRRPSAPVAYVLVTTLLISSGANAQSSDDSLKLLLARARTPLERLELVAHLSGSDDVDTMSKYAHVTVRLADSLLAHGYAEDTAVLIQKGNGLWNIGCQFTKLGSQDSGLVRMEQAVELWTRTGDKADVAFGNAYLSELLISAGHVREALSRLNVCLTYHREARDSIGMMNDHAALGRARDVLGDFAGALDHYSAALHWGERTASLEVVARVLNNIAVIYSQQGLQDTAVNYFKRAADTYGRSPFPHAAGKPLTNIADILCEQKRYEEALLYCARGSALARTNEDGYADLLVTKASIHRGMGGLDSALALAGKAVSSLDRSTGVSTRVRAHVEYGLALCAKGFTKQALEQAALSKAISDSTDVDLSGRERMAYLFSEIYAKTGPAELALKYYKEHQALIDSVHNDPTARKLRYLELRKQEITDSLRSAAESLDVARVHADEMSSERDRKRLLLFGGVSMLIGACGLWIRLRRTRKGKREAERERDLSDTLLRNILPGEIAEELKNTGGATARDIDQVSILFTDFKGFTQLSEQLTTQELVAEIDICFKAFDGILATHGIEKIKTIGDAYMAAGGLSAPLRNSARDTVFAAHDMQEFMQRYKAEREGQGKPAFEMRVGIHTGPVVAGIVGVKKFQYDIWGDTVNIASRMESSGEVGQVNISEATLALVSDEPSLSFTPRGKVQAKGKGELEMFFVHRDR